MIYSEKSREKTINRIILCLVISLVIGLIGGAIIGHFMTSKIVYTNNEETVIIDEEMHEKGFKMLDLAIDDELQEYIYILCKGYDIDYSLVLAIIEKESNFDETAISDAGDYGLFQINEMNHRTLIDEINIADIMNPYENARAGIHILRNLFDEYESTGQVLMAYNMGETGASELWEQGVYTTSYVDDVLTIQNHYMEVLEDD